MARDPRHTVVLLHGLGQSPQVWQPQVTALGVDYALRCPWVRGLRPTDRHTFDLDAAVGALAAQLDVDHVERASIVGASVGAAVATRFAASYPDRVECLVLSSGLVAVPRSAARAQALALRAMPRRRYASAGVDKARVVDTVRALATIDLSDDLDRITAPTLVVVGAKDKSHRRGAEQLVSGISGARLEVVDGAGHHVNADGADAFTDLVREALARRPGRT